MAIKDEAVSKIRKEAGACKGNQYVEAMKDYVAVQLELLVEQNEEFAQAVVDGGSFSDMMNSIVKGVGQSISDIDILRRAAEFYFPGAVVEMQMKIYMSKYELEEETADGPEDTVIINLEDFL